MKKYYVGGTQKCSDSKIVMLIFGLRLNYTAGENDSIVQRTKAKDNKNKFLRLPYDIPSEA